MARVLNPGNLIALIQTHRAQRIHPMRPMTIMRNVCANTKTVVLSVNLHLRGIGNLFDIMDDRDWAYDILGERFSAGQWNGTPLMQFYDSMYARRSRYYFHTLHGFQSGSECHGNIAFRPGNDPNTAVFHRGADQDTYEDRCYGKACQEQADVVLRLFWTNDCIFTSLCSKCYLTKGDICEYPDCTVKGIRSNWNCYEACVCGDPPVHVCALHRKQFFIEAPKGLDGNHHLWKWIQEVKEERRAASKWFQEILTVICKAKYQPIKNKHKI